MIFLSLLFVTGIVVAGNRHHKNNDIKYIEYGKSFDCIKKIVVKNNDKITGIGSCVFISPKIALTSAHMVNNKNIIVFITDDKEEVLVDKIICHELFESKFGQNDIAILRLSNNPFKITKFPELYKQRDELGKLASFGGYGITGTGLTGYNISDAKLRYGTNFVDSIVENLLCCTFSNENPSVLEFITTPGDSGGGLFIDSKLAGINSCLIAADKRVNGDYGDESCHTRISDYVSWIGERSE